MTFTAHEVLSEVPGISIQLASELLGIPQATLRSWEIRYDFPRTSRTAGGHRRYTEEGLNQLRLMRDEIARGSRAGDASQSVRLMLRPDNPFRARIDLLLEAARHADAESFRATLDNARDDLGLAETLDSVLKPAMRQVGEWWAIIRCEAVHEQFATRTARGWLARVTATAPPVSGAPTLLVACGPRDMHTLGLEAFAALMAENHRGCRILGAKMSEQTLLAAAESAGPAASVVIVSHLSSQRRSTVAVLRAVHGAGCSVFYAGNAFWSSRDRRGVPGTYLGEKLSTAADILLGSARIFEPAEASVARITTKTK